MRLEVLEKMYLPERVVPATYEFKDIAGLVKGASRGEGLGNKFLSHIRETDAICEVVRCFEDSNVVHVDGNVDPIRDIETINLELALADLETVTNRINRISKKARMSKDKDELLEYETLEKLRKALEENTPIRLLDLTKEEKSIIKSFNLLTEKPLIYLANVNESDFSSDISNIATSLYKETKQVYCREDIICKIVENIEQELEKRI